MYEDKLCKQAELEVAHIEERKKQLQAEIEEERERVNKLNQMKGKSVFFLCVISFYIIEKNVFITQKMSPKKEPLYKMIVC